nr:hypothetical protein [Desulfonatronovibrio hydrogenovorans]
MTPPAAWLVKRHPLEFDGETNSDLLHYAIDLLEIIEKHNQDKDMIQLWQEEVK